MKPLKESHSEKYILDIQNKTLDEKGIKKIGFPLNDSVVRRSFIATTRNCFSNQTCYKLWNCNVIHSGWFASCKFMRVEQVTVYLMM